MQDNKKYTVMKFSANWCSPCQAMQGMLGVIDIPSNITLEEYDIDNEDDMLVANKYRVRSIPSLVMQDEEGNIVKQRTGAMSLQELQDFFGG